MKFKKVIGIIALGLCAVGLLIISGFAGMQHNKTECTAVDIKIIYPGTDSLILPNDILAMLTNHPDSLINISNDEIDCKKIEENILKNPCIEECHVYTSITGKLHLEARQKEAVLHVFPLGSKDFYLGRNGSRIPSRSGKAVRNIIASGHFKNTDTSTLNKLLEINHHLEQSPLLSKMISQLFVEKNGTLIMIPILGQQEIELGKMEQTEKKLKKLERFYSKGPGNDQWSKYKKINLEIENQIVCTKR